MSGTVHEFARDRRGTMETPLDGVSPDAAHAPQVGVIYNPRSHRNRGRDLLSDMAPHIHLAQPGKKAQLPAALQRFKERGIELLVINGGDGTVRDVLSAGDQVFGTDWPVVAILPKGKTNALAVDLEAPGDWSLQCAIDAFRNGRRIRRRPIRVVPHAGETEPMLGFILGAGAFTTGIAAGQDAHRIGAFNSLAVAVTTLWGAIQSVFGTDSNPWRRGVEMELLLGESGAPMEHSGLGDPNRRQILVASTLERFPARLKPFGSLKRGLKLAVMDKPVRHILLLLPVILAGWSPSMLRRKGLHQISAPWFEWRLGDRFILDGEAYPAGHYRIEQGPELEFVAP